MYNKEFAKKTIMEYWGYDDLSMFSDQQIFRMYHHTLKYRDERKHKPKMKETYTKKQQHDEVMLELQNWINTSSFDRSKGENHMPMCEVEYKKRLGYSTISFIDKDFNPNRIMFKLYIDGTKIYSNNPHSKQLQMLAKEFHFKIDENTWKGE